MSVLRNAECVASFSEADSLWNPHREIKVVDRDNRRYAVDVILTPPLIQARTAIDLKYTSFGRFHFGMVTIPEHNAASSYVTFEPDKTGDYVIWSARYPSTTAAENYFAGSLPIHQPLNFRDFSFIFVASPGFESMGLGIRRLPTAGEDRPLKFDVQGLGFGFLGKLDQAGFVRLIMDHKTITEGEALKLAPYSYLSQPLAIPAAA